jgi:hypothetical protein
VIIRELPEEEDRTAMEVVQVMGANTAVVDAD